MRLALLFQALGTLVLAYGLWMLAPWLGVAALGLLTIVAGIVLEVEGRDNGTAEPGKS